MSEEKKTHALDGSVPFVGLPLDKLDKLEQLIEQDQSRRQFIRIVGRSVFALALLDVPDIGSSKALAAEEEEECGSGTPDQNCSSSNSDENCGFNSGGSIDQDQSCSSSNNDESCNSRPGDYDQSCSSSNNDEACGQATTQFPTGKDPDATCSTTNSDQGCSISQVPSATYDEDQNCTATSLEADQACGDCDDNHDSDEHCGQPVNGQTDPDDLCGHQSWAGPIDQDNTCSATVADQGCGMHTTQYGGQDDDPDQHCVGGNADMHCTAPGPDATCDTATNPSTTSPDETCSATDTDQACGHYDKDQSCSTTTADEACGKHFGVFGWNVDTDQFCTAQGGTNANDNTNTIHNTL